MAQFQKDQVLRKLKVISGRVIPWLYGDWIGWGDRTDFNVRELSSNVELATYKVMVNSRYSLRSSIWQRQSCDWQMIFHQGTPLSE